MTWNRRPRGAVTIYFVLFLVLFFGFLVMAVDVGRMYLIQGELQTAATAAAMASALQLVGTANATLRAGERMTAAFDAGTGGDNRFNLRMNRVGGDSQLTSEATIDFYANLLDALSGVNGGQGGGIDWASGIYPKYSRVQVTAQAPVLFAPLLGASTQTPPTVAVSAVAGISVPLCTVCGIDALAVEDLSAGADDQNFGFTPGGFYTLFLTQAQQGRPRPITQAPLGGTLASVRYALLYHLPNGPSDLDLDNSLFALAAGGVSTRPDDSLPGFLSIGTAETAYAIPGGTTAGQDILCGLNTRFGVDLADNLCNTLAGGTFSSLAPLFQADTDAGRGTFSAGEALQDFSKEYEGNQRRILTLAVIDSTDAGNVLNFRQFLLQMSAGQEAGLNLSLASGAFVAQYIGTPVPVRCGTIGGPCRIASGVGRVVLHS